MPRPHSPRPARRLRTTFCALALLCGIAGRMHAGNVPAAGTIDRRAWVQRHSPGHRAPHLSATELRSPLSVGNGGFAFTVDPTGLQTFAVEAYRAGFPLETLARWAWVRDDNPHGYQLSDTYRTYRHPDGRAQAYPSNAATPAGQWLRRNPRLHPLGVVGLDWIKPDGSAFVPGDVTDLQQSLDLWSGVITSHYRLRGVQVEVLTACDPSSDTLAIEIHSALVASGELGVRLAFPRGHDPAVKNTPAFDWSEPGAHLSRIVTPHTLRREVGSLTYEVESSRPIEPGGEAHIFRITGHGDTLSLSLRFGPAAGPATAAGEPFSHMPAADTVSPETVERARPPLTPAAIRSAAATHWRGHWRRVAALDLSGSTDPRAALIERRVVLSHYLLAIQSAGEVPPQESGLTCNTWYGKHHTEMIWWHTAHFALAGRPDLLERNLAWYRAQLPAARALAQERGLRGARWAKMVGPDLRESPGGNPFIVWNQPHTLYLAELLFREASRHRRVPGTPDPDKQEHGRERKAVLDAWAELVDDTAAGLASMLWLDPARDRYVLGPPLWIAQEIHDPATSQNPGFELAYWRWALEVAQTWRERRGLARETHWDDIIRRLTPLPTDGGRYVALESHPDTWRTLASRHDHPQMLMAYGFLPYTAAVDRATMERTLDAVLDQWDWETKIWGWDYPMIAMTATRLGRPEQAVEILLRDGPNNRYLPNGHCPQRSDVAAGAAPAAGTGSEQTVTTAAVSDPAPGARPEIAAYLPANGAFLATVALMVAGWDGCEELHPGFPKDGRWTIRAEGWRPLP